MLIKCLIFSLCITLLIHSVKVDGAFGLPPSPSLNTIAKVNATIKVTTTNITITGGDALTLLPADIATNPTPSAHNDGKIRTANIENDVLHFSYELENLLDRSKQPCQDFYGYVCGKSMNNTKAQMAEYHQHLQENFLNFLNKSNSTNDEQLLDAELKLKQFYDSCQNARSAEELKSSLMYRTSGGWPALDDINIAAVMQRRRRNHTWLSVLSTFHEAGMDYIFRQRIEIKSNKRIVHLEPANATRYTLRKFEQLAIEVMQDYAIDAGRARLVALEILSFERSRRDIIRHDMIHEERELTYAELKTSCAGLQQQLDWDAYFKRKLGKSLKPSDTVRVKQLPKLLKLFELLENTLTIRLLNWIWIDYLMDKRKGDCQTLLQTLMPPVYKHIVEHSIVNKVEMAQMYVNIGRIYDELLLPTPWIDEISQQNSKQLLGRIIHITLNGDARLDADYAELTITKRNFYRNLEKLQRFQAQQTKRMRSINEGLDWNVASREYFDIFPPISQLLKQQNLTTPLNYILIGERLSERMITGGSTSTIPGAWRSMDSEQNFTNFKQCLKQQKEQDRHYNSRMVAAVNATASQVNAVNYNLNDLILKLLAQQQTLRAFERWQELTPTLLQLRQRLDNLLAAGKLQLSLIKLYFVGTLLADCRHYAGALGASSMEDFVHSYLRNSKEFSKAFGCRVGDKFYARNICKVF